MNSTDVIKTKIMALLAKAKSTDSEAEADAFFSKAQELMEKHQLELHDLGVDDPLGKTDGVTAQPGPPSYKSDVQCALARYYGAKPIIMNHGDGKWHVEIVGPESSRVTTELMTDFVWKQVGAQAGRVAELTGVNKQHAIREVAKALCLRIRRLVAERKADPALLGGSYSIVVVDAIDSFIANNYGRLVSCKTKAKSISRTAMDHAKNINLNRQVGGSDTLRLK